MQVMSERIMQLFALFSKTGLHHAKKAIPLSRSQWHIVAHLYSQNSRVDLWSGIKSASRNAGNNFEIITRVPAGAFYPAPKVDSAILRVEVRDDVPLTSAERDRFFRVVQAGFAEKRKQLHNSLTHHLHYKNEQVRSWLQEAGVNPSRRAETLSIEEWLRLWREIEKKSGS